MDELLRNLRRRVVESPDDIELAQRYIRALERIVGISLEEKITPTHDPGLDHAAQAACYLTKFIHDWGRNDGNGDTHNTSNVSVYASTDLSKTLPYIKLHILHCQYDASFEQMAAALPFRAFAAPQGQLLVDFSKQPGFCDHCQFEIVSDQYDAHANGY